MPPGIATRPSASLYNDIDPETLQAIRLSNDNALSYWSRAYPTAEVKIDSVEIEGRIHQVPSIKKDSTLTAAREAFVQLASMIIEKEYPEMQMGMGKIIPIDSSRMGVSTLVDGTEVVEIIQTDTIGAMAAIEDYGTGGPAIDVTMERAWQFLKYIGGKVIYSIFEVEKSRTAGMPLDSRKLAALQKSAVKYLDYGGYFGDPAIGLNGVLTINGCAEYVSPARIVQGMPADQMLAILSDVCGTIPQNTNNIERPKKLVTPLRVIRAALNTRLDNNQMSVYEALMNVESKIGGITEWITDERLKGAAPDGSDISLVLPDDPVKLCLKVAQPYTQLDEQLTNMAYTVHAYLSTGLVQCTAPQALMVCFGL